MKRMKLKRFLMCLTLIIVTLVSVKSFNSYTSEYDNPTDIEYTNEYSIISNYTGTRDSIVCAVIDKKKIEIQQNLLAEVTRYIKKQSPSAHATIPEHIVKQGLANNIDICFIMAQTEIETNYGTTGAGRSTSRRSMFGVAKRKYNSYYAAIDDYINVLKDNYLGRGRTEHTLMNNYITFGGYRYASNPNYETYLKKTYVKIAVNTKIKQLQKQYKSMS